MKKLLLVSLALLFLFVGVLVVRTLNFSTKQLPTETVTPISLNSRPAAARLARALTYPTISLASGTVANPEAFDSLGAFIDRAYPLVRQNLSLDTINTYSRLYTWTGTDSDLKPVLLMGHLDVVPVDSTTAADWKQAPFGGRFTDQYIWGRGALDDKHGVFGILEAVERLLGDGFTPTRTVYLAFGHDEEVGGSYGAAAIAQTLQSRGVELEFVLDEGGLVGEGLFPGLDKPVAFVGIAEKGYVSLELRVEATGGHSSTPPAETAVGLLSEAITKLEADPFPAKLNGATRQLLEYVGPELPFLTRLVVANLWLFEPIVISQLAASPAGSATVRTTTAPTILEAGVKDNVLPTVARGVVNHRILPGETIEGVIERVRTVIDHERVTVERTGHGRDPSPVSPTDAEAFQLLQTTIGQLFPGAVVTPYLVVGGTDARNYTELTDRVYRFNPIYGDPETMKAIHGINERISVENYARAIQFYHLLITNAAGAPAQVAEPNTL